MVAALVAALLVVALGRDAVADRAPAGGRTTADLRRAEDAPGWSLYDRLCLACHGQDGDGHGPARPWLWPPPRDLTRGQLKWRSVPLGAALVRADLRLTLQRGAPGTAMPGYADVLDDRQLDQLIEVVLRFAPGAPPLAAPPAAGAAVDLGAHLGAPPAADPRRGEQLWSQLGCASCHGASARGDGPAAAGLRDAAGEPVRPYDLTTMLRRPRPGELLADQRRAIATSVATGLAGTPMPAFARPAGELWALADFVLELRALRLAAPAAPAPRFATLAPEAIAADRQARVPAGSWPGSGEEAAALLFGGVIPAQGPAPARLAPAQASLSARQCARCHAAQYRQWRASIHARAASPGLLAQLVPATAGAPAGTAAGMAAGMAIDEASSCQRCHAPLAEQLPPSRAASAGPGATGFDPELRHQGVTCAACHVRGWQRLGPPRVSASLLPLPGYPRTEAAIYERSDFCLPCHQLPPRQEVAGRPLLNTYKEWLDGPYFRRGVQCQHCHMPNREHTFRGVHDRETFRQGVAVTLRAGRERDGAVQVRVTVGNVGAGHYLPTTPTPAAWLSIELLDAGRHPIAGARSRRRIGRKIAFVDGAWRELEDTRIAPGRELVIAKAWTGGAIAAARWLRVRLEVAPDDYYEGFYRARLGSERNPEARAGFERALARARANHYVAFEEEAAVR